MIPIVADSPATVLRPSSWPMMKSAITAISVTPQPSGLTGFQPQPRPFGPPYFDSNHGRLVSNAYGLREAMNAATFRMSASESLPMISFILPSASPLRLPAFMSANCRIR